jgi:hypothetical protein
MTETTTPQSTLADVLRIGLPRYQERFGALTGDSYRTTNAIIACRTDAAGAHRNTCPCCGHTEIAYNSCRNRHCPRCQAHKARQWAKARTDELLPLPYFHLVFTMPRELNRIALQNQVLFYDFLFHAVAETLMALGEDTKRLGGRVGFFAVLHTWTQTLMDHPHVHVVIPGGGITSDGKRFKRSRPDFIFPVRVMSSLFRGKLLASLKHAATEGCVDFQGSLADLRNPARRQALFDTLYQKEFIVYAKRPFAGPQQVVNYLSRYTHRVAIGDRRIVEVTDKTVAFTWRDRADNNTSKIMRLAIEEFIRRFLLHLLPQGFVKIRYFGFMANAVRKKTLALCRELLAGKAAQIVDCLLPNGQSQNTRRLCPCCNMAPLVFDGLLPLRPPD